MTIVLQHRFWDLIVTDDRFEVKLTFDGVPERLVVPFAAVKVFFDPSVPYGLQFDEAGATRDTGSVVGINEDTDMGQTARRVCLRASACPPWAARVRQPRSAPSANVPYAGSATTRTRTGTRSPKTWWTVVPAVARSRNL